MRQQNVGRYQPYTMEQGGNAGVDDDLETPQCNDAQSVRDRMCGGGAELKSNIQTTTQGQQLLDLKKAYDAGAISKEEYEQLRKKIVESR